MKQFLPVLLSGVFGVLNSVISLPVHAQKHTNELKDNQSITLNFHDVRDDVLKRGDQDQYAINTQNLNAFFDWLSHSKWNPVTLKQILDAREGKSKLPENAILLSFDDGTLSGYTRVFPLLKQYNLPAVFAIVTGWTDGENDGGIQAYGKNNLMTWAQMREMQQSGLVEFASHSDLLHQGILANPQGNQEPAAITRQYFKKLNRYETDQEFKDRIQADLTRSKMILEKQLGVHVDAIIWPYGAVNPEVEQIALKVGLPLSFSLGRSGINSVYDGTLKRLILTNNPESESVHQQLLNLVDYSDQPRTEIRHSLGLNLKNFDELNATQEDAQLGQLLERIKAMAVQRVFIDAFSQDGDSWSAYFPNRYLAVKKDMLNRFVWQLNTRVGVSPYLNIPLSMNLNSVKFEGIVSDLVKNNTGVSGLQFDVQSKYQALWQQPNDPQLNQQLRHDLLQIQGVKKTATQYVNLTNTFKIVLHERIAFNQTVQLQPVLEKVLGCVDLVHLTLELPIKLTDQKQLLKQLAHLDDNTKQRLILSFNLNQMPDVKMAKQVQSMMILLQQVGFQNFGVEGYQLQNSQFVQQNLYSPLSLNDSPLSYQNPFSLEKYVEPSK